MKAGIPTILVLSMALVAAGCSGKQKIIDQQQMEITELQSKLDTMEKQWETEKTRADQLTKQLDQALAQYQRDEQVLLDQVSAKSIVTLSDEALFRSGSTRLTSTGEEILGRIGRIVDQYPDREILVEGHTDNVQIARQFQSKFKSNWELSSARANSALHFMREIYDVPPHRMASVGYGEYRPVADNSTPEGRAMNRRVVIVIGPAMESLSQQDPGPAAQPLP